MTAATAPDTAPTSGPVTSSGPLINPLNSLGLDAVRILSIFVVVAGHYITMAGMYEASGLPFPVQSYGVVTMFTLSGFLIMFSIHRKTKGLQDFGRYRFLDYLIDRGSRIFVVYWPVLVAVLIANRYVSAHYGMPTAASDARSFVVNLLMLQLHPLLPASVNARIDTMAPTWALALEWWIYLFVGWALLVVYAQVKQFDRQRPSRPAHVTMWGVAVLGLLSVYPLSRLIGIGTSSSVLAWFVGAGIFFVYDKIRVTRANRWGYLTLGIALCLLCLYTIADHTEGYAVDAIYSLYSYLLTGAWFLCFLVFGRGCDGARGRVFSAASRTAKFFSGYMYSLFLTHYSVWMYLHFVAPGFLVAMDMRTRLITQFLIANIVALVIGVLLERNGQRVGTFIRLGVERIRSNRMALPTVMPAGVATADETT